MQSAFRWGPRRPGAWPGSGHRVMSSQELRLQPRRAAAPPLSSTQRGRGASGTEGAGGVDVIGADAAVSSIMDGDDADGGAKPARRGERN